MVQFYPDDSSVFSGQQKKSIKKLQSGLLKADINMKSTLLRAFCQRDKNRGCEAGRTHLIWSSSQRVCPGLLGWFPISGQELSLSGTCPTSDLAAAAWVRTAWDKKQGGDTPQAKIRRIKQRKLNNWPVTLWISWQRFKPRSSWWDTLLVKWISYIDYFLLLKSANGKSLSKDVVQEWSSEYLL